MNNHIITILFNHQTLNKNQCRIIIDGDYFMYYMQDGNSARVIAFEFMRRQANKMDDAMIIKCLGMIRTEVQEFITILNALKSKNKLKENFVIFMVETIPIFSIKNSYSHLMANISKYDMLTENVKEAIYKRKREIKEDNGRW